MPWHAHLSLDYLDRPPRTVARHRHEGPLRILQSLYPEGDRICHNVLVHPPGGLVGGDTLDIAVHAQPGTHGLVTTPGATRFYRSEGEPALQRSLLRVDDDARLEWLPLEAICYSGCVAENRIVFDLAPTAELLGWDVTAFGLPHAGEPFVKGDFQQHIELPGVWLERGRVAATDARLLDGPVGLAGHRCMASIFFACGAALPRERRERALEVARAVVESSGLQASAGATAPHAQIVVVRALAPVVEPAMALMRQVWAAWRHELWHLPVVPPRIWSV